MLLLALFEPIDALDGGLIFPSRCLLVQGRLNWWWLLGCCWTMALLAPHEAIELALGEAVVLGHCFPKVIHEGRLLL